LVFLLDKLVCSRCNCLADLLLAKFFKMFKNHIVVLIKASLQIISFIAGELKLPLFFFLFFDFFPFAVSLKVHEGLVVGSFKLVLDIRGHLLV